MVVVKPRTVRQDQIALHLVKRKWSMRIDLGEVVLFLVLLQTGDSETARVLMRVLTSIVPAPFKLAGQVGTDQFHRFLDGVDGIQILAGDAIFRFNAEEMHRPCQIIWLTNRSSVGRPRRKDDTPTTCSGW